jgi:hypothetical protein
MRGRRDALGLWCLRVAGLPCAVAIFAGGCETWVLIHRPGASTDTSDASLPDLSSSAPPPTGGDLGGCGFGCPPTGGVNPCPPGSPLDCFVNTNCPNGGQTTIIGTVYDPAGRNPLPGVVVYVPEDPATLQRIPSGTSGCSCQANIGDYVTAALTDAQGHFTLRGVPTGNNVPLVIQAGKWQRVITVLKVADCRTTELPTSGTGQARLPRNHLEGSLPQMAVLTGGCDNVACFLRSVGVDASEFSAPGAGGRVDVYKGLGATGTGAALSNGVAGDCTTPACPLWSSKATLERYDRVFLGCECNSHDETKLASSLLAMHDWLAEGGRVFATHSQATWFSRAPSDVQSIAAWASGPASGAVGPFAVDTSFAAGRQFAAWLATVGAADADGGVPLNPADVSTSVTTVAASTSAWIRDVGTASDGGDAGGQAGDVKLLSASLKVAIGDSGEAPLPCGKVVFTDIHPGGGQALQATGSDGSGSPAPVPAACDGAPLTPGEEALEYFLFNDESSTCVPETLPPPPPPPPPDGG